MQTGTPRQNDAPLQNEQVVENIADNDGKPTNGMSLLKMSAVLSGAVLQLATTTVVFGYLGYQLARKWNHPYLTAIGVFFGLGLGISGLVILARRLLGDKP